ncbi:hypothetical protein LTR62_004465 [Meristemomyces frigidus]|uniref:MYND-type domain-containing protein n=1 Tax=Meristemomyces frigidus TaxID=1508187 RepID=A0AAN7TEP9_9PEZI|nr:hypothetical protein LTR62_004465 [Meristemomyces frigidus]
MDNDTGDSLIPPPTPQLRHTELNTPATESSESRRSPTPTARLQPLLPVPSRTGSIDISPTSQGPSGGFDRPPTPAVDTVTTATASISLLASGSSANDSDLMEVDSRPLAHAYQERGRTSSRSTTKARGRTPSVAPGIVNHGLTAYVPVFREQVVAVVDQSNGPHRGKLVQGSDRGTYLHDLNVPLRRLELMVNVKELRKPPHERKHFTIEEDETRTDKQILRDWHTRLHNDKSVGALNEWWGPLPIITEKGLGPGNSGHPSSVGRLTAQYGGSPSSKKRKSYPEGTFNASGKKAKKKKHRRYTSPQTKPEVETLSRGSTPESTVKPATICGLCRATKQHDGSDLLQCERCGRNSYCSKDCQGKHAAGHASACKCPGDAPERSPTPGPSMADYIMDEDEDSVLAEVLRQSAVEAGIEPDLSDEDTSNSKAAVSQPTDSLPVNECSILDFRLGGEYRFIDYLVKYKTSTTWRPGPSLLGPLWTGRMTLFWTITATPYARAWREKLDTELESDYLPGPLGRFVLGFQILEHRNFNFCVQDLDGEESWRVFLGEE